MNSPNLPIGATEPSAAQLVERHGVFLRNFARALVHDTGAASDLEQETWRVALEHREPLRDPRAWLAATAKHLAWTAGRSERRRAERERRASKQECDSSGGATASLDAADLLQRALRQLEEPFRSTVAARYLEGLEPGEIANRDGTPLGTVKSRLKRGLAKLREELDAEHGGERQAWCQVLVVGLVGKAGSTAGALAVSSSMKTVSSTSSFGASVPPKTVFASTTSGGLWTAAIAMKLSLIVTASLLAVVVLWNRGASPGIPGELAPVEGGEERVALVEETLQGLEADGRAGLRSTAEETASVDMAAPAIEEYALTLSVRVLDESGRPASGVFVALAPEGHPFNHVGQTDRTGKLDVHWRSRQSAAQVDLLVRAGRVQLTGIQRIEVKHGTVRRVMVSAPLGEGSEYGIGGPPLIGSAMMVSRAEIFPDCVTKEGGEIAFRLRGEEPMMEDFEVSDHVESDVAVPPPATLSGAVLDAMGQPVPGYAICWSRVTGEGDQERRGRERRVVTSADGTFRIESQPGRLYCTAGPMGDEATLEVDLKSGEARTWNPIVSHAKDIMLRVIHPSGGDVDSILVHASYDDGTTLWMSRAITSDEGYATILNWPQAIADLALVAPEKVAPVPLITVMSVRSGELFEFTFPKDSELTVLPVRAATPDDQEPRVNATAIQVFNADLSAGAFLPMQSSAGSWSVVLPGGVWQIRTSTEHGAFSPLQKVVVDGDQPIDLGVLQLPIPASLVIPEIPKENKRWVLHRCMEAFDSLVYDSDGRFEWLPSDRVLKLPAGRYRMDATGPDGSVRSRDIVLEEGERLMLELP